MIVGTGTDICEVDRIRKSIERFGERFMRRCFTADEIAYCQSKANFAERFAARFAAKEAAMKAIGTGLSTGVGWQHIEVGHAPGGRPILRFTARAAELAAAMGAKHIHLSLTHTQDNAMAMVILEG
jgi:holo-[acyl-carrier protein] synthase